MAKTPVSKTLGWLVILFAVALVGFLYFLYLDTNDQLDLASMDGSWMVGVRHKTVTPTPSPTPTATSATAATDATAGWKTYTNASKGISFKYPQNYYIIESSSDERIYVSNYQKLYTIANQPSDYQLVWIGYNPSDYQLYFQDIKGSKMQLTSQNGIIINYYEYNGYKDAAVYSSWGINHKFTTNMASNISGPGQQISDSYKALLLNQAKLIMNILNTVGTK